MLRRVVVAVRALGATPHVQQGVHASTTTATTAATSQLGGRPGVARGWAVSCALATLSAACCVSVVAVKEHKSTTIPGAGTVRPSPTPKGWTDVAAIFAEECGDSLCKTVWRRLYRADEVLDSYKLWKRQALDKFGNVGDAVLCEKLSYKPIAVSESTAAFCDSPHCPSTSALSGQRLVAAKAPTSPAHRIHLKRPACTHKAVYGAPFVVKVDGRDTLVALHPNTFPYNLDDTVRHDVLWSERRLPAKVVEALLDEIQGKRARHWYENLPSHKSVPSVFHVHIFSKPSSS